MSFWDAAKKVGGGLLDFALFAANESAKNIDRMSDDELQRRINISGSDDSVIDVKNKARQFQNLARNQRPPDYHNDEETVKWDHGAADQGYDDNDDAVSNNTSDSLPVSDLLVGFFEYLYSQIGDEEILNNYGDDWLELIMMEYLETLSDSEQQALEKDDRWNVVNIRRSYVDWRNCRA